MNPYLQPDPEVDRLPVVVTYRPRQLRLLKAEAWQRGYDAGLRQQGGEAMKDTESIMISDHERVQHAAAILILSCQRIDHATGKYLPVDADKAANLILTSLKVGNLRVAVVDDKAERQGSVWLIDHPEWCKEVTP